MSWKKSFATSRSSMEQWLRSALLMVKSWLSATLGHAPQLSPTRAPGETRLILKREYPVIGTSVFPVDERARQSHIQEHTFYVAIRRPGEIWFGSELTDCIPIPTDSMILDVGAGTGIWACDVASRLRYGTIIAMDMFDYNPAYPSNVKRYIGDANDGLPSWPGTRFDFIHLRGLNGCINDWSKLIGAVFHQLKHGGHVEYYDISLEFVRQRAISGIQPAWVTSSEIICLVANKIDRTFHVDLKECEAFFRSAGFQISNGMCQSISVAGPSLTNLEKSLRSIVVEMIVDIVTFYHSTIGTTFEEHQTFIKTLKAGLHKASECSVSVKVVRVFAYKPPELPQP